MLSLSELYYQFLLVHSLGVTLTPTSDVIKRQQQYIHSVCTAYKGLKNASSSGLRAQAEEKRGACSALLEKTQRAFCDRELSR